MTTEEKARKLILKLMQKNDISKSKFRNKILGYAGVYPVFGKPHKNPIIITNENDSIIIANALRLEIIPSRALSNMSKRQHVFIEKAFKEILEKNKSQQENLEHYKLEEKKTTENKNNNILEENKSLTKKVSNLERNIEK